MAGRDRAEVREFTTAARTIRYPLSSTCDRPYRTPHPIRRHVRLRPTDRPRPPRPRHRGRGRRRPASTASASRSPRPAGCACACEGRVVVTGMGKSGHVGSKIAATLASTGTPVVLPAPGRGQPRRHRHDHGASDVVLALSNSGETDELLTILPVIKRLDVPLIAMTGNAGLDAGARRHRARSTSACPPRPARSTSRRPPAPPRRSRWATRWRSRCSRRAASPRRTSRARTRAAASAAACCCTSRTSCARGDDLPARRPGHAAERRACSR